MKSVAATLSEGEMERLQEWPQAPLAILPLWLPGEGMSRESFYGFREGSYFRTLAMPGLAQGSIGGLPSIPSTKEIKFVVSKQYGRDELEVIQLLESSGSETAGVIEKRQPARDGNRSNFGFKGQ